VKLSRHFTLAELTVTNTGVPNKPEPEHLIALYVTAFGMEQVRSIVGNRPCLVSSGYRCPRVNRLVGGVPDSDHALGYATDFRVSGLSALEAGKLIVNSSLEFDQLILERNASLLHISFHPRLRRQVLRQPGGPGSQIFSGLN
jgi:zinc D-Ala-D-Ala carboxypeptidase